MTPKRLTTPRHLVDSGLAPPERLAEIEAVAERYAIGLTPALAALIRAGDAADPIARQFMPDARELIRDPAETADPIGDDAKSPVKGLVHRYPDRVLIKLVAVCAVYCRFCFRRERIGPGSASLSDSEFAAALDYVRGAASDPGSHPDRRRPADAVAAPHRANDRGDRGDRACQDFALAHAPARRRARARDGRDGARAAAPATGRSSSPSTPITRANSRAAARAACRRLDERGIMLVSQSVLLRGVNDDADTLEALMRAFLEARVKPYYLHHGDLAPGTAHWRVPIARGQELMRALRVRLSGLATPAYMLDIPGGFGKVPIGPPFVRPDGLGGWIVTGLQGGEQVYLDRLEGG